MDTDYKKEKFRQIMRKVEQYSGCKVLSYAVLDTHYHILLEQPDPKDIDNKELMRRLNCLYGEGYVANIKSQYDELRKSSKETADHWFEAFSQKHLLRMHDVSEFQKTLKLRYTKWYNVRFQRTGHLWQSRFKSIIVQNMPGALFMMATYIELNPVRKKYVTDIKDYRFCSYGEAFAGSPVARANLIRIVNLYTGNVREADPSIMNKKEFAKAWQDCIAWYRVHIFTRGKTVTDTTGKVIKPGFTDEQISEVLEQRGRLTTAESMHCRVRYMADGFAFGSQDFCEEIFQTFRGRFPEKRKAGPRIMRKVDFGECCTLRNLQKKAVRPPE
jgi:REP element-mobilizing transposase RayT